MPVPPYETLMTACDALSQRNEALRLAYERHGVPRWRTTPARYHSLARTVAYQQISLKAAGAIWARTVDHFGGLSGLTAEAMLASSDDDLRGCGLSRPKTAHMKSIAQACVSNQLNLRRVLRAPIDAARRELMAVKGIGPWTAEIFLLYSGVVDAFPVGDIGLLNAYQNLLGSDERPKPAAFTKLAEAWRPYRGVAAHLLWTHFHAIHSK